MGEYAYMRAETEDARASDEKIEWFNRIMENRAPREYRNFRLEKENGLVYLVNGNGDYYGEYGRTDEFAYVLSKAIDSGVMDLEFVNEEGDRWGYLVWSNKAVPYRYRAVTEEPLPEPEGYKEWIRDDLPPGAEGNGHGAGGRKGMEMKIWFHRAKGDSKAVQEFNRLMKDRAPECYRGVELTTGQDGYLTTAGAESKGCGNYEEVIVQREFTDRDAFAYAISQVLREGQAVLEVWNDGHVIATYSIEPNDVRVPGWECRDGWETVEEPPGYAVWRTG